MKTNHTSETLTRIFEEEKKRIVFWYDADKEFEEELSPIRIDDATLLRLDEHGALELKNSAGNPGFPRQIPPLCAVSQNRHLKWTGCTTSANTVTFSMRIKPPFICGS